MPLSAEFLVFCALLVPLYFLLPRRTQPYLLLAASLLFYAFAGLYALGVALGLTLLGYLIGRLIGRAVTRRDATLLAQREDGSWDKPTRRAYHTRATRGIYALLWTGILAAVGILVLFKTGLPARAWGEDRLLPLGLSYMTLSLIAYWVDSARGQVATERNFARFALFLLYFPALWQGPVNRYTPLAPHLFSPHSFDPDRARQGMLRALWGGVKKVVLADTAAVATAAILAERAALGGAGMLLLIPLYTLQLYGDFSGGMDICLGLSQLLGIPLEENFDKPFASTSPAEHWRRWHRSLGRFFADYVFYPLSLCRPVTYLSERLGRRIGAHLPLDLSLLVTWLLTGLWHGLTPNFLVWGLANGLLILLGRHTRRPAGRISPLLGCIGTVCIVALLRTLDLDPDPALTFSLWGKMFSPSSLRALFDTAFWSTLGLRPAEWVLLGLGVLLMWWVGHQTPRLGSAIPTLRARIAARPYLFALLCSLATAAIVILGKYGVGYDAARFIYGQF